MTNPELIVGAGLAGLLAAHAWPGVPVVDAAPGPKQGHKALLRFRTQAVSQLTGIEFKPVTVRKGIFSNYEFVEPNIRVCNYYASKVVGSIVDRSIWNIEPAERFLAPESFYEQLVESVGNRIEWGTRRNSRTDGPVVSTAPLASILEHFAVPSALTMPEFKQTPIRVKRYRLPGANVHQTVYFSDPWTPLYRASLCGDLLIAEEVVRDEQPTSHAYPYELVCAAFGIDMEALVPVDETVQPIGKLQGLPSKLRRQILFELTSLHNVYTLGRFATWRNVLLDDVVNDIGVIKRLMRAESYDLRKFANG